MNITNIRINHVPGEERLKAIVSVTFDDMLAIHDIKVIEGPERRFLAMPSRRMGDGTYRDIVHPIAAGLRRVLETAVLEKYTDEVENAPARSAFEESQLKMDA